MKLNLMKGGFDEVSGKSDKLGRGKTNPKALA